MLTNQAVFSADGQSIMYIDETSKVVMVIGTIVCSLSLRSHHFLKANSEARLVAPQKKNTEQISARVVRSKSESGIFRGACQTYHPLNS